jgi:hypothetical protein
VAVNVEGYPVAAVEVPIQTTVEFVMIPQVTSDPTAATAMFFHGEEGMAEVALGAPQH